MLKRAVKAKNQEAIDEIRSEIRKLGHVLDYHYVNGFQHPRLFLYTNSDDNNQPVMMHWGLIPKWVKDSKQAKEIASKTLNARIESIAEKPSYKGLINSKRGMLYVDSFFEYHDFNGKKYPFRIYLDEPMGLACLWDEWQNPENGIAYKTFSIVTTRANQLMAQIHNNPKGSEDHRMPVIISDEGENLWLDKNLKFEDLRFLERPYPDGLLKYHTVGELRKSGNTPDALKEVIYDELKWAI
jgi:putative SOS response-associated peptidase YedK